MHDQNSAFHHAAPYTTTAYDPSTGKPVQATYLPPERDAEQRKAQRKGAQGAGAGLVGIGLLLAKFKGLLYVLLSFKWLLLAKGFLLSGASFFVSVWFYALFYGWKFALVLVLLILVHELGHTIFMRAFGVPSTLTYFIPGFGAFVSSKARPASPLHTSYIALGGPLVGGLAAAVLFFYGLATGNGFWLACAYTGFLLNAFNLLPVMPLDGGQVVAAISPRIWIFGLAGLLAAALVFHVWSPLLLLLLIIAVPTALSAWRGGAAATASPLAVSQRVGIGLAYFAMIGFLGAGMLASHVVTNA